MVWTSCRRKTIPFLISQRLTTDDNNQHIEWLDLESSRACDFPPQHFLTKDKNTTLTLPKIPSQPNQKCPRTTENSLEVIDLEYKIETEFMRNDTRMESISSTDDDKSDCQMSITEGINELALNYHNNNDEDGFSNDEFSKCAIFLKRRSKDNSKTAIETTPKDLMHEATRNHVRADTPHNQDKAKFTLPPLKITDGRRHTVHEVPSITVCQEGETREGKDAERSSVFDPRFLMPTEVRTII